MPVHKILSFIIGKPVGVSQPVPAAQLSAHKRAVRRQSLLRREAQVGSAVFGAVPAGHQRDFFCLDKYTWIWSEQWLDPETKTPQLMTVRYEFQPRGVLKVVNNVPRGYVRGAELRNLVKAIKSYGNRVATEVYGHAAPIVV